jgi:hypothetical protein
MAAAILVSGGGQKLKIGGSNFSLAAAAKN